MERLSRFASFEILIYGIVTLIGFGVVMTAYQHGLPFIDYPDEMTMWTRGRATIDPTWDMFQPEYPPGMVWLSALVQQVQIAQGDSFINPAGATQIGRFTSLLAFTVTLALVMRLARALLTDDTPLIIRVTTSFVAGMGWLCLPLAVRHARYAMPDCWLCMWFVASLLAAVTAWKRSSERWLWLSVVFGVLATVFKWQAAVVFAAGGVCCLRFWPDRARTLRLVLTYGVIVAAFGAWVVFGRHALEGGLYMPGTTPGIPTPLTVIDNLVYQSTDIGSVWIFGLLPLMCLLMLLLKPLRLRVHLIPLVMLPLVILALNIILSINGSRLFPRHYLPALALLALLAGVGVGLLLTQINRIKIGRTIQIALSIVLLIAVSVPLVGMARDVINETQEQTRPDRRVMLIDWLAANALDKVTIITDVNLASAADPLYGYRGAKITTPEWGAYIPSNEVTDAMLQAENVRYLVAPTYITFEQLNTPLTPLLINGDDVRLRGETWTVYQVGAVQGLRSADDTITFGDSIQLRGFAVEPTSICAGDAVTLHLSWGAVTTPTLYYVFFLHLANDEQGELSAPINGQQPIGEHRPTITWTRADELLIADPISVSIPSDTLAGTYDLWLGLFEPESSERLYLPDGKHYAAVEQVEVKAC